MCYCEEWVVVQRFRFQPAQLSGSLSSQGLDAFSLKQNCILYFCHFVAVIASLITSTVPWESSKFCKSCILSQPSKTGCICPPSVLLACLQFYWLWIKMFSLNSKIKLHFSKNNFCCLFKATMEVMHFQLICDFTQMLPTNKCRGKTFCPNEHLLLALQMTAVFRVCSGFRACLSSCCKHQAIYEQD